MSLQRQFELVYLLLENQTLTASELSKRFEVSTRTIYRDVDLLSASGIPIYASRGRGGGISLLEDFTLDSLLFSANEKNLLLDGLQTLEATNYPEAVDLLNKVGDLFQSRQENWLSVDFSPWGSSSSSKQVFSLFKQAIFNHTVLQFEYTNNKGGVSFRKVEPLRLLFKYHSWYLLAYCQNQQDFRTFKLNRMKHIKRSTESFTPRKYQSENDSNESHEEIMVALHLSSESAYRVYDEFDSSLIQKQADQSFIVTVSLPKGAWLEDYLFSFGDFLLDVKPSELKIALYRKATKMATQLS